MKPILVLLTLVCASWLTGGVRAQTDPDREGGGLDLVRVPIESPEARELLRSDMIQVRRDRTEYRPQDTLPVVILEEVNEDICLERMASLIERLTGEPIPIDRIERTEDLLTVRAGDAVCWTSTRSGAIKFTRTEQSMVRPSEIGDFKAAVQIALDVLGRHRLLDLHEAEEVDLLFVSSVANALTVIGPEDEIPDPQQEFVSDYYVGFGRRIHGVPVIGSKLVIRLSGTADLAMVQRHWRPIVEVTPDEAFCDDRPLRDLIAADPSYAEKYQRDPASPDEIEIVDFKAGYLEAPADYRQSQLRPGVNVCFRVGQAHDETYPQMVLSLEPGGTLEQCWGRNTEAPRPVVDAVEPGRGPATGGTELIVHGDAFEPGAAVFIGRLSAENVRYISPNRIVALAPPGDPGTFDILTVNPDGQEGRLTDAFTYEHALKPAVIAYVGRDADQIILGLANLTLDATHVIERSSTGLPGEWIAVDGIFSGPTETVWSESLIPDEPGVFYRIRSEW